jgi:biotin carboxyl carrier protein
MLSEQAQKNLGLTSIPLRPSEYWKVIEIPGMIVDRPGISDRGVIAPVTAVVTKIHRYAGDTVEPGQNLFTLRLVGESFQTAQREFFRAVQDRQIAQQNIERLSGIAQSGVVPSARLIELRNELRRHEVSMEAFRQDLQIRGLSSAQIEAIARGEFVSEVIVSVPEQSAEPTAIIAGDTIRGAPVDESPIQAFEVQEVTVELGQQVQAGQRLCTLSNHLDLFIEGRGFLPELPLLQRAAAQALPIQVELKEGAEVDWDSAIPDVVIHHISNSLDERSRTVAFYMLLRNQFRAYERDGQRLFLWRFRPGQRVRLKVNVERLTNVFVLPAAAVVQEGPEYFVFRQNGDLFDRKPVHVIYQTQDDIVLANDGSVPSGIYVAGAGAVQINRVLRSQRGEAPSGVHVHADGSVHENH